MNKYKINKQILSFLVCLFVVPLPFNNSQAAFNPNAIISDYEFEDYESITQYDIQNFLNKKNSYLSTYVDPLVRVSAAQLIYDNATLNRINPKVILATLQKEQSLITDPSPTQNQLDWAGGYGICDTCSKSDPKLQKYRGFANQIDFMTSSFRLFHDNPQSYGYKVNSVHDIDDTSVTITNAATHAMYLYTPHLHGNQNFVRIWEKWFVTTYPDGSLLQNAESGGVYLIQNGNKRPFGSRVALVSRYNPDRIISVSPEDLDTYIEGPAIRYAQYSLIRSPKGTVYLIRGEKKHGITSGEVMRQLGFNPEEVIDLKQTEIDSIPEGEPITFASAYPTGALLQDPISGGVWFAENGIRHAIWSPEILKTNFSHLTVTPTDEVQIGVLRLGNPIGFQEGELVRSFEHPSVYVISNNQRRPILSGEVFEKLGYKWENVILSSEKALSLHPIGDPITIEDDEDETA